MEKILDVPVSDLEKIFELVTIERLHSLDRRRIFITGGTGFIGKNILAFLLYIKTNKGFSFEIDLLSRNPDALKNQFPEFEGSSSINFIKGDVKNFTLVNPPDYIIHAATDVLKDVEDSTLLEIGNLGAQNILDIISKDKKTQLVFLSSGAVYDTRYGERLGFRETDKLVSSESSAYARSKTLAEKKFKAAVLANKNLNVSVARCFAFMGPHLPLNARFAAGNFIDRVLNNKRITINGDGTAVRSYLYTIDLVTWLLILLFESNGFDVFNVGGDEAVSINELASRIVEVSGSSCTIQNKILVNDKSMASVYFPSVDKFNSRFSTKASMNLDQCIARMCNWVKEGNR